MKLKTKIHQGGGKNPIFDETMHFKVDSLRDEIIFTVFDVDVVENEEVCFRKILVKDLYNKGKPINDWL